MHTAFTLDATTNTALCQAPSLLGLPCRRIEWRYLDADAGPDVRAIARKLSPTQAHDLRETTDRTMGGKLIITGRPTTIQALCRLGLATRSGLIGQSFSARWESAVRTELGERVAAELGGTFDYVEG